MTFYSKLPVKMLAAVVLFSLVAHFACGCSDERPTPEYTTAGNRSSSFKASTFKDGKGDTPEEAKDVGSKIDEGMSSFRDTVDSTKGKIQESIPEIEEGMENVTNEIDNSSANLKNGI